MSSNSKEQTREQYVAARAALLSTITSSLQNDPRFVAAWLAGSFGRGEQRWSSDLDLHVVVAQEYSDTLCATPWASGGRTTPARLALFQQFGTPTIIFEAHSNNMVGGTFTYVAYQESGQNIDWMLIPQGKAYLEHPSLLLFNRVELPEPPTPEPLTREQAAQIASDSIGFFWMIAAANSKNLLDGDLTAFHNLLLWLQDSIRTVQFALQYQEAPFTHLEQPLLLTPEEQAAAIRQLCSEMETLMPQVVALGGYVPTEPRVIVEKRLALL